MSGFRSIALVGGALLVGFLLGIVVAGRSCLGTNTVDKAAGSTVGSAWRESGVSRRATQSASVAGGVLRGSKPGVSPKLPAPKLPPHSIEAAPIESSFAPSPKQSLHDGVTNKVARARIAPYLHKNSRNAASLLAAAYVTGDGSFLREAMQNFPQEPRVLLAWLMFGDAPPAERRRALDAFCQAAPQNALGDYLAAFEGFQSGDVDTALRVMMQAADKTYIDDYTMAAVQDAEEAYVAAGYSRVHAMAASYYGMLYPQASQLVGLSKRLRDVREQYAQAGDVESAQAVAEMGLRIGAQVQGILGNSMLAELIGMRIEQMFLERLDPDAVLVAGGQTPSDRLKELDQRKRAINELKLPGSLDPFLELLGTFEEQDVISFLERVRLYGECEATLWLQNGHGNAATTP